jgi:3-oxoacyl-[acyl-carrier-protein] synthase-1
MNNLFIYGTAAVAASGVSSRETAANVRASLSGLSNDAYHSRLKTEAINLYQLEPEFLNPIADSLQEQKGIFGRTKRLLQLAATALENDFAPFKRLPPLFLALPEHDGGMPIDPKRFIELLAEQTENKFFDVATSRADFRGRAGALLALKEAASFCEENPTALVLVGGVDSYDDPVVLQRLERQRRLILPDISDAMNPGEGAGFLLIGRDEASRRNKMAKGIPQLACIAPPSTGFETGHLYSKEIYRGEGLLDTLEDFFSKFPQSSSVKEIYSTMNGEIHWTKELGLALGCYNKELGTAEIRHPAENYGDVGAASGALLVILAAIGIIKGYRQSPALVYASSDHGDRAVTLVSAVENAVLPPPQTKQVITEFLVKHDRENDGLFIHRGEFLHEADCSIRAFDAREKRIAAHIGALCEVPEAAQSALLSYSSADTFYCNFAAIYGLLKLKSPSVFEMIKAIFTKEDDEEQIEANARALAHGGDFEVLKNVAALPNLSEMAQLYLVGAMTFYDVPAKEIGEKIAPYLNHEDATLRKLAWQAARHCSDSITIEQALAEIADAEAEVRSLVLETLAWKAHQPLLEHCRRATEKPTLENLPELTILAVLSTPSAPAEPKEPAKQTGQTGQTKSTEPPPSTDAARILALADKVELGAARFTLLGTLGQAEGIEPLLNGIKSKDEEEALAAAAAFERIVGLPIAVNDEKLPDIADAKRQWKRVKSNFLPNRRYSGGVDVTEAPAPAAVPAPVAPADTPAPPAAPAATSPAAAPVLPEPPAAPAPADWSTWGEVDMQTRWEHNLRQAYAHKSHLRPVDLERFPLLLAPNYTPPVPAPPPDPNAPPPKRRTYRAAIDEVSFLGLDEYIRQQSGK